MRKSIAVRPSLNSNLCYHSLQQFDVYLKQKDERFGLRNIQTELEPLANKFNLYLEHKIEMPSGNVSIGYEKREVGRILIVSISIRFHKVTDQLQSWKVGMNRQ